MLPLLTNKHSPLDSIFCMMLQECVHIGGISCIYRQGIMDLEHLQLPGIMHGAMGPLSNTIISNVIYHIKSVMKLYLMFYCDRHISIYLIYFALMYIFRIVLFLVISLAMFTHVALSLCFPCCDINNINQ